MRILFCICVLVSVGHANFTIVFTIHCHVLTQVILLQIIMAGRAPGSHFPLRSDLIPFPRLHAMCGYRCLDGGTSSAVPVSYSGSLESALPVMAGTTILGYLSITSLGTVPCFIIAVLKYLTLDCIGCTIHPSCILSR